MAQTQIRALIPIDSGISEELARTAQDLGCSKSTLIAHLITLCRIEAVTNDKPLTSWFLDRMDQTLTDYDDGDLGEKLRKEAKKSSCASIFDYTRSLGRLRQTANTLSTLYARLRQGRRA